MQSDIASCRLFNFNTPRHHYQRVQFLYSESRTLSHLLLFRHKESIDVYAIHTGQGQHGIEIVDPAPHSEEIARRFIWFQFDLSRQCIYFLCKDLDAFARTASHPSALPFTPIWGYRRGPRGCKEPGRSA